MKHYEVEITSTIGGYISVNAKSAEEAKTIIEEAISELGLEALDEKFYHNHQKKYADLRGRNDARRHRNTN